MPRGKKTPPEVKEKVLASLAVTGNGLQTARDTNVPESTVRGTCKENADEFAKLRAQKRQEIIDAAYEIAAQGTILMQKRMKQIAENDEVLAATDLRELSTPTATMIDKARLMEGQTTENIGVDLLKFEDF